jgi:hypothetical protein
MEVHPVADLFPMLADDELKDLAADIAERGLLQPIVLDADGRILDGRNRHAACAMAGVEPEFVTYEGPDPEGFALAVNVARRNLNKGQQAVVIARRYKNYTKDDLRTFGVSKQYVSWARLVARYDDLADAVLADTMKLREAYDEAGERSEAAATRDDDLARLRAGAPDLADQVTEERLSLEDALALLDEREKDDVRRTQVERIDAVRIADGAPAPTFADRAESGAITWLEALTLAEQWSRERVEAIDRDVARVHRITESWAALRDLALHADRPRVAAVRDRLADPDRHALDRILAEIREIQ